MLREISSRDLAEWQAYYTIKDELQTKAMLQAKAGAGLEAMKARGPIGNRR